MLGEQHPTRPFGRLRDLAGKRPVFTLGRLQVVQNSQHFRRGNDFWVLRKMLLVARDQKSFIGLVLLHGDLEKHHIFRIGKIANESFNGSKVHADGFQARNQEIDGFCWKMKLLAR